MGPNAHGRAVSTVCCLLAAGAGRRFRAPSHKLLAPIGDRPLFSVTLEAMCASGLPGAVVCGAQDLSAWCPPGVRVLHNTAWAEGLATSLACAVDWAEDTGATALVVGLADAPGIPADAWRRVAESPAAVAVASFDGVLHPPVRLAASVWTELARRGDAGARALFRRPGALAVPCPGVPADIDTVDDLEAWRAAR